MSKVYVHRIDPSLEAPFMFCSPDWARNSHGGTLAYNDVTNAGITTDYPVENMIDGNRNTFCEITKLGRKTSNYATFRFQIGGSSQTLYDVVGGRMNVICIENDPEYPISSLRVYRYDGGWGGTQYSMGISAPAFSGGTYLQGSWPRVDGEYLFSPDNSTKEMGGFWGRYIFIPLDYQLFGTSDAYVQITVTSGGKNDFGVDGSLDNGLWAGYVDETLQTSDPYPSSEGANNNYMQLDTTAGGADKNSRSSFVGIRASHGYMFGFGHKQTGTGVASSYQVKIDYYDENRILISGDTLWDGNGFATWGHQWTPVNYREGGKRYSGLGSAKHEVPVGTFGVNVSFRLNAHAGDAQKWQIDDVSFYSTDTKHDPADYSLTGAMYLPRVNDQSGTIRIKRVSMFNVDVGTSTHRYAKSLVTDWQRHAPSNPISMDTNLRGKSVAEDFYGNVAGQFIPKAGLKRVTNMQFILDQVATSYMQDMSASENEIGIISPNGDFGEYVILDGVKYTAIGRDGQHKNYADADRVGPEKVLTQVIMPLSEV